MNRSLRVSLRISLGFKGLADRCRLPGTEHVLRQASRRCHALFQLFLTWLSKGDCNKGSAYKYDTKYLRVDASSGKSVLFFSVTGVSITDLFVAPLKITFSVNSLRSISDCLSLN